jgi:tRNA threonylcarbamoyladenosine biosynthesis protein TsaE
MTGRLVVRTSSAEQTRRVGAALGAAAQPGDTFLLEGAFGVGKTVLVQGIAAGLCVPGPVTSPSFVLMVQHQGRLPLFHVDLYRLDGHLDDEMLESLEDAEDAGGVCAIEWPAGLPAELRSESTSVRIEALDDDTRDLTVESPHSRLLDALRAALEAR